MSHDKLWEMLKQQEGLTERRITELGFTSELSTFQHAGLVCEVNGKKIIVPGWRNAIVWVAAPRRHRGSWTAHVTYGIPRKGDIAVVITKSGDIREPKQVKKVSTKYGVSGYFCELGSLNPSLVNPSPVEGDQPVQKDNALHVAPTKDSHTPVRDHQVKEAEVIKTQLREMFGDFIHEEVEKQVALRVKPQVVEVHQPDTPAVQIEGSHYLFPRLLRLVSAGFNVFMWGPPGTGKTTAAMQVAEALGRKAEIDTLDPTTARSMVQGYMTPNGDPVHNVFTRCWEGGAVYVADEVDLAPGHVQTLFNSALANGQAPLAWGNVERNANFAFVATGNTAGRPTAAFPDRRPMSSAFADRLYFMYWPLDPQIECRVVGIPCPPVAEEKFDQCDPVAWVKFVRGLREWAANNAPGLSITPRASLLGIKALAAGESPDAVADGLIFRGCDSDLRKKALRNVHWSAN